LNPRCCVRLSPRSAGNFRSEHGEGEACFTATSRKSPCGEVSAGAFLRPRIKPTRRVYRHLDAARSARSVAKQQPQRRQRWWEKITTKSRGRSQQGSPRSWRRRVSRAYRRARRPQRGQIRAG
jgi:hypothetical protein